MNPAPTAERLPALHSRVTFLFFMHRRGLSLLLSCLALAGPCPAIADEGIVGIWSSVSRTQGGLGPQWVFTQNGEVTHTFGALVDFKYEINGRHIRMTLLNADRSATKEVSSEEFSIDGDTLTVSPQTPDRKRVMQRAGKPHPGAHPIVGDWTYTHYTGGPARMRYSRSGIVQLSVPFQTHTGTYRIDQGVLAISLREQKSLSSKYRRDKDHLTLVKGETKESRYLKFEY